MVLNADVSNHDQMQTAVEQAKARFGLIHGVVHAAGLPGGGIIELKTAAEAARVLSPKLEGSIILNEVLETQQLDFLVFCSALNAVGSIPGQIDYCSANAFQDAYAYTLSAHGANVISINWDAWQEVGLAANVTLPEPMRTAFLEDLQAYGIKPAEGVKAFARILAQPMPQFLLSTTDWQQRSQVRYGWGLQLESSTDNGENSKHNLRP